MCFAVISAVPGRAPAKVAVELVHADGTRFGTWIALAFVYVLGAVVAGQSVRAHAVVLRGARYAGAVVAGVEKTSVVELVTILAHVADPVPGAEAGVVVHVVHAGGSVAAGRRQALV